MPRGGHNAVSIEDSSGCRMGPSSSLAHSSNQLPLGHVLRVTMRGGHNTLSGLLFVVPLEFQFHIQ